jgi:uncharacterized RDD family membrane protein YckC
VSNHPAPPQVASRPAPSIGIYPAAPYLPPSLTSMPRTVPAASVETAGPWLRLGSYLLESILITVTLGIGWVIWAAITAGSGQTPAKRILNLRVVDATTLRPATLGTMLWVRGILAGVVAAIAIPATIGVLVFMPFWDRRNQNLWDKVSNTFVIADRG